MIDNKISTLKIGKKVTVKTIEGIVRTGEITKFGEHIVILACGVQRFVVAKSELEKQGYQVPKYKGNFKFTC
ncbi:hypothetical protein [Enterococcus canintestini]|uniref:Uncharacterized protein n=1 Tax=Enterococcus canintestini TaxID=317010 RepID=A0A267HRL8_9ENTE|nr:hypothetical protein [Enterococcus canintestini]PAB00285.1 hypothetical protein AKL21_09850 [Enterococcus canintestini]